MPIAFLILVEIAISIASKKKCFNCSSLLGQPFALTQIKNVQFKWMPNQTKTRMCQLWKLRFVDVHFTSKSTSSFVHKANLILLFFKQNDGDWLDCSHLALGKDKYLNSSFLQRFLSPSRTQSYQSNER